MATFSDNFNRADSSDLGANWVEVSGDWSIVSNQLSPGAAGGTIILRAAGAMDTNDNSAQVAIAATTTASQGVWCRGNSNITNGYLWRNNGSSWDLFSVVGGSFTNIGTYAAAAAPGDVAKVQAVGSTIKAFVNGVERVSVTDTGVTTGTSVGIRSDSAGAIRYDDFAAEDVTTTVTGSAVAAFGGLTGAATGVRTVNGTAASQFGGLAGAANGTRNVIGGGALIGGALSGSATGLRTVIGSAAAQFGGLSATATSPSHVTGTASAAFGGLTATATGHGPAPVAQGSWQGLLDILREGAQLARDELERDPIACLDCGEPLRTGPNGVLYCPFDGSTWAAGNRWTGHVSTAGR